MIADLLCHEYGMSYYDAIYSTPLSAIGYMVCARQKANGNRHVKHKSAMKTDKVMQWLRKL